MKRIIALLTVFFALVGLVGCRMESKSVQTEIILDTVVSITVYGENADSLAKESISMCKKYDAVFSATNAQSELYKLNRSSGPVTISDELSEVIKLALEYCEISKGAFDITMRPVIELWDFKGQTPLLPQKHDIDFALQRVGYQNVVINGQEIELKNGAQIDLGAIAKGYITDKIVQYLKEQKVKKAVVNLGGNVYILGEEKMTVGIQKPFANGGEIACEIKISNCSAVTSGVYQRYFKANGELYHHILNTETGYPENNDLLSVTVITESSARADALSTMLYLMGSERAMQLVESMNGVEAVFILSDQSVKTSSGV